ncbi:PIF1-like helicase-domain-containing protein, partial [Rhodofomes roseus]
MPHAADEDVYDYGLFLLDKILNETGHSLLAFDDMPRSERDWERQVENPHIIEQLDYDRQLELTEANNCIRQLNANQRDAFSSIMEAVSTERGGIFFLNGPGGTGKTYVYNTVCHKARAEGWIVLCVASSGIASLLLKGGRTAHSRFKIPVENLNAQSTCAIRKESRYADLFRVARLII